MEERLRDGGGTLLGGLRKGRGCVNVRGRAMFVPNADAVRSWLHNLVPSHLLQR